jgi:hypothetical protein
LTTTSRNEILDPSIAGIEVATDRHNGTVRIHIGTYLAEEAQEDLTALARGVGLSDAYLLSSEQTLILIAKSPCRQQESLKRLFRRFRAAFLAWFDDLDDFAHDRLTKYLDPRNAMAVYSRVAPEADK